MDQKKLSDDLEHLKRQLRTPQLMRTIRQELLTADQLDRFRVAFEENSPILYELGGETMKCDDFDDYFDFVAPQRYLQALAQERGKTFDELALDLAVELGLIGERKSQRMYRALTGSAGPSGTARLSYNRDVGELRLDGNLIGKNQTRNEPTQLEEALMGFEDRRWPRKIPWSGDAKGVARRLRAKFAPHIIFSEADNGKALRWDIPDAGTTC